MKKVLAIVLALIMALSCAAVAFADDAYVCKGCGVDCGDVATLNSHIAVCQEYKNYATSIAESSKAAASEAAAKATAQASNTCPYCGRTFSDEANYDAHIDICYAQHSTTKSKLLDVTASQVLDEIVKFFEANTDFYSVVQNIIIRLMDLIENIGTDAVSQADVAGAVDDLEAKVAELPIIGDALEYVHNLINTLKQKIKDFYASDVETVAEDPVSTGSTSVGVVAFAVVSVAAAAAFVCTKKKEN